jgi:hypothetical protein
VEQLSKCLLLIRLTNSPKFWISALSLCKAKNNYKLPLDHKKP